MTKKRDLTSGSIYKALLWVAIPTLLSSLVQMAYNLTDMFWVAKVDIMGLVSADAVAGVGIAGFYMWFGFGLILLVKVGVSVNISHAAGRDDHDEIQRIGNNGFIMMMVLAIIYSLIGYFGKNIFVGLFTESGTIVYDYAVSYLGVISTFVISMFMVNLFSGIYDGLGLTIMTFLVTAVGLVLNMILDPFFILDTVTLFGSSYQGLGMTVKGAATATVISQSSVLLIYLTIYVGKSRPFDLHPIKHFSLNTMKKIYDIGFPIGLQSVLFTIIAIIMTIMQVQYGTDIVATQRLGSQIEAFAWMVASGFQVALASFVGQNYGAGRIDRVKEGYKVALKMLIPYGIIISVIMYVFAEQLFGVFFRTPEALRLGKMYLEILSFSQLFMILELATAGGFNGLGKTRFPSTVGIIGNALRIPMAYLFGLGFGFAGIWWAIGISSILKGIVLVFLFVLYLRRLLNSKDKFQTQTNVEDHVPTSNLITESD